MTPQTPRAETRLRGYRYRCCCCCCCNCILLLLLLLLASCVSSAEASSASSSVGGGPPNVAQSVACYSCVYYANIRVPASNQTCISGSSIETINCPEGSVCKVTFLQDSRNSMVHASRSCQPAGVFRGGSGNVTVILNARTTMYCRQSGCNNNWIGAAAASAPPRKQSDAAEQLHCWVGYGRHIDQFKMLACSPQILRLTLQNNGSSGQKPVCLLAQLTRQIEFNGRVYESAAYMADCAPHASSVYGQNYPMYEYERVCRSPLCNSGRASGRLEVGLVMASSVTSSSAAAAVMAPAAAAAAACLLLLMPFMR